MYTVGEDATISRHRRQTLQRGKTRLFISTVNVKYSGEDDYLSPPTTYTTAGEDATISLYLSTVYRHYSGGRRDYLSLSLHRLQTLQRGKTRLSLSISPPSTDTTAGEDATISLYLSTVYRHYSGGRRDYLSLSLHRLQTLQLGKTRLSLSISPPSTDTTAGEDATISLYLSTVYRHYSWGRRDYLSLSLHRLQTLQRGKTRLSLSISPPSTDTTAGEDATISLYLSTVYRHYSGGRRDYLSLSLHHLLTLQRGKTRLSLSISPPSTDTTAGEDMANSRARFLLVVPTQNAIN